ncbi:MAG: metal ABC transporter permease [Gemmataceae bacterium]|nr:metal ABC transporter permease [Gemmataceae bacterium]
MESWFSLPGLGSVALGTALLGFLSGVLGSFAVLRKQSLLGDAISHACLPGIILAFLIFATKNPLGLMGGAMVAGAIAILAILGISRFSRVKEDASMAIVLSVFFGAGLMLLTWAQQRADSAQAGLTRFLFGQAATLMYRDAAILAFLTVVCLSLTLLFWKQLQLISFDPGFAASLGMKVKGWEVFLSLLQVVVIVAGLEAVGVVLMSALLVAPAVAARQWTNRLGQMVFLAGIFGALSGSAGALLGNLPGLRLPTGPVIVLIVTAVVLLSLVFSPLHGLLFLWSRQRRGLQTRMVLENLASMARGHGSIEHGHNLAMLQACSSNPALVKNSLKELIRLGLAREVAPGLFSPTGDGILLLESPENWQGEATP